MTLFPGKADLNWHRVRSDLELEISMLGHLLKNICEPYVICNKKGVSDGASAWVSLLLNSIMKMYSKKWVRFWVRFLSLFVHICPFIQTTKASKLEAFLSEIENIEFSLVRQEGLDPTAFGSGGQRPTFCKHLFLWTLARWYFRRIQAKISSNKTFRKYWLCL